jgi:hypothetical protein
VFNFSKTIVLVTSLMLSIVLSVSALAQDGDSYQSEYDTTTATNERSSTNNNSISGNEKRDIFYIFQLGGSFGGDQLVNIDYSDGTSESIDGGDGYFLDLGIIVKPFPHRNIETQLTAGILRYESQEVTNGSLVWSRSFIDIIQCYRFQSFRIGAGVTWHIDPTIDGSGFASSADQKADENSTGNVYAMDWFSGDKEEFEFTVGLKYVDIDYKFNGTIYSGDSIGLSIGFCF